MDETCPEIFKMFSLDASQSNRNKYIVIKDSNEIEISSQQSNGENWLVFLTIPKTPFWLDNSDLCQADIMPVI